MNSFFKQLLGSLVQIGINELSKKTCPLGEEVELRPVDARGERRVIEDINPQPASQAAPSPRSQNNVGKEEYTDDSGKDFSVRVSRRGQQHQVRRDQKSEG